MADTPASDPAAAAGIALGGERRGALGLAGGALVPAGTAWGRRARADERRTRETPTAARCAA
ncbi:hypothetical protein ACFXKT_47740, partial [Streptomyces mirabilis]